MFVRERPGFLLFFFLVFFLAAATAGGCASHGATQNDASSDGRGGSGGDDASPADTTGADSGSPDGGLWPCAPPADPTQPSPTLAATGCMDTAAVTRFASSAHGYEINSPLWSDQADKERAFVLPPGGKIHVVSCATQPGSCLDAADDGKWVFPAGTTFLKSFGFDGKLVETRLFVALPDGTWVGYSYQCNESQTGANGQPGWPPRESWGQRLSGPHQRKVCEAPGRDKMV